MVLAPSDLTIDKHGPGTLLLKGDVHGATDRPCPVNRTCRHDHGLPFGQLDSLTVGEFDLQLPSDDQEELVRIGMMVPAILTLKNREPHAIVVDVRQHIVSILLGYCLRIRAYVDDRKAGVTGLLC